MSSKHRQPRLRASCDGCFLAKVKCSKARPICSRCLACGIECRYSPSSRAGKPKSDGSNQHHSHNHSHSHSFSTSPMDMGTVAVAGFSSMTDEKGMLYTTAMPGMAWQNHHTGMDGSVGSPTRNHSISSELAMLAMDENSAAMVNGNDVYNTSMPWTPPADISMAQFADSSLTGLPMTSHAGYSMHAPAAAASAGMPWMEPSAIGAFPYNTGGQHSQIQAQPQPHQAHPQMHTPGSSISSTHNYFPSPSTTPSLRQSPTSGHKSVPLSSPSSSSHHHGGNSSSSYQGYFQGTCACFTSCLHSLQALHNASTPVAPPFDVVLALNRNAVDGCSAMLSCSQCMSRSGTHTAAMLLATVIGKVTSFYKNASQSYFTGDPATASSLDAIVGGLDASGPTLMSAAESAASISSPQLPPAALLTGLGVSLGAYHLQGEEGRWLELEILNREMKKLEDVYSRFREVCGELSEDVEVSKAMIGYLGHNLGSTLNIVGHSKGDLRFI